MHLVDSVPSRRAFVASCHFGGVGSAQNYRPGDCAPHFTGEPAWSAFPRLHYAISTIDCLPERSGGTQSPRDLIFRCKALRSMPTNSAVLEILPPKRSIWASR